MTKRSFRKVEHMILPQFRKKINQAESKEDIKKFFVSSILVFFENAFEGRVQAGYEDIKFKPYEYPYFSMNPRLFEDKNILSIWKDSDLHQVIEQLAEQAMNHYMHLEKHREKTNSKIRRNSQYR